MSNQKIRPIQRSDAEWRRLLDPEAYAVMRQHATERPGSHDFAPVAGVFRCKGCGAELFDSAAKFNAHCGWPSFWRTREGAPVGERLDTSHFMQRTEVHCQVCGSHLGHVFNDGPEPSGRRYCINGVALTFIPDED